MSLVNRRILITRSKHQASELAAHLEGLGASTVLIPAIEIIPPSSLTPLFEAIAHLDSFDWIVFTSVNAVEAFAQRCDARDWPSLSHLQTAVIGPATARAAARAGLTVALIPPKAVAESLACTLLSSISPNSKVLLIRAESARDHLPNALIAAGAHLTIISAYRTVIPHDSVTALKMLLNNRPIDIDVVTFTSSSTVINFFDLLEEASVLLPTSIVCASIGPITSQTLREHSLPVHVEADEATVGNLAKSIERYFEIRNRSSAKQLA